MEIEHYIEQNIAKHLNHYLEKNNMTRSELADRLGTSLLSVKRYCHGGIPYMITLGDIMTELDLSIYELIGMQPQVSTLKFPELPFPEWCKWLMENNNMIELSTITGITRTLFYKWKNDTDPHLLTVLKLNKIGLALHDAERLINRVRYDENAIKRYLEEHGN